MRAYFAARATYYDLVYLKPERTQDLAFLHQHIPARLSGRSVLEVACGTGYWTQFIAPRVPSMAATDWTPEPLNFARLRPHTENVTFSEADAFALPTSLGLFQAAFAGLWFSHVPISARAAFLRSLHTRLVPGSRVLFLDNSEVQCDELPIVERDAEGNTHQHRPLPDGTQHRVLKNFPKVKELEALVATQACAVQHTQLDNFWLFEYDLNNDACPMTPPSAP